MEASRQRFFLRSSNAHETLDLARGQLTKEVSGRPHLVIPTLVEVAECSAPEQREPAPTLMLRPIVQHVAALAERLQVRGPVVGWVVIEMRAGQNHAGRSDSPLPQPQRG